MKWWQILLIVLLANLLTLGLAALAGWIWFNTPLADPIVIRKLAPDYTSYWLYIKWFGAAALVEGLAMIGLLIALVFKRQPGTVNNCTAG